ncbi:MAG: ArnT family glycosyltransferase [Phycisphaerae bacterium]
MAAAGTPQPQPATRRAAARLLAPGIAVVTLAAVGIVSPYALLTIAIDGVTALLVLVPAALAGWCVVPALRLGPVPPRWHVLLGATLGIGGMSLLVLTLGLAGVLHRSVWIIVLGACTVAGLLRYAGTVRPQACPPDPHDPTAPTTHRPVVPGAPPDPPDRTAGRFRYLWSLVAPFLVLALLAASTPPGLIWSEEGYGYDVLEYHLEMPKEYLQAGRITYAPHNVYANFPANVEMLYLLGMILTGDPIDAAVTANMIHTALAILTVFAAWVAGREWSPRGGIVAAVAIATTGWPAYLSGLAYVENGMLFFGTVAIATFVRAVRLSAARHVSEPPHDAPTPPPRQHDTPKPHARPHAQRGPIAWLVLSGLAAGLACGCKYTAVPMIALPLGVAVLALAPLRRAAAGLAGFSVAALVAMAPWLVKNTVMTGNPVFPLADAMFHAEPPGWGHAEAAAWQRGHSQSPDDHAADLFWHHIPGDPYQRFGPAVFLLALGGCLRAARRAPSPTDPGSVGACMKREGEAPAEPRAVSGPALSRGFALAVRVRARLFTHALREPAAPHRRTTQSRIDVVLAALLACQCVVWVVATHLYARFAVVMLIPLCLLAGRTCAGDTARWPRRIVAGVLVLGAAWNFTFAARLWAVEWPGGVTPNIIYEGHLPAYEYFTIVNRQLPRDAHILVVGDARAFYFQRRIDYCVVFNRNPFVRAVETARDDADIMDHLHTRGYTHVLVNWSEIARLARTYGFSPAITPHLFDRLTNAGLTWLMDFPHPTGHGRYVTLYEVPQG